MKKRITFVFTWLRDICQKYKNVKIVLAKKSTNTCFILSKVLVYELKAHHPMIFFINVDY